MTNRRRLEGKASWVGTLIVLGAMGCSLLTGCGGQNVSGTYSGACINETYGGTGMLRLILNQRGNQLSGTLTISGDLAGGGQIFGRIDGNNVTFVTRDMIMGQLTWSGHVKGV